MQINNFLRTPSDFSVTYSILKRDTYNSLKKIKIILCKKK